MKEGTLNPNIPDSFGFTPIHHACIQGNIDCIKLLTKIPGINLKAIVTINVFYEFKKFPCILLILLKNIIKNFIMI